MRLQRKEVTWSQLRVGIFIIIGSAILVWGLIFAGNSLKAFRNPFTVYTVLDSAFGLKQGDPVRLAGIVVGEVSGVGFIEQGGADKIQIRLRMNRQMAQRLKSDSIARVETVGFTENRYVDVSLGTTTGSPIADGATLTGMVPIEMPAVLDQAITVSESMNRFLTRSEALVDRLQSGNGTFAKLLAEAAVYTELNRTLSGLSQVVNTLNNGNGLIPKLLSESQIADNVAQGTASAATFGQNVAHGDGSLGKLSTDPAIFDRTLELMERWERVMTNFEERLNRMDSVMMQAETLVQKTNDADGTVGRLVNTPDLHNQLYATSQKIEQLTDRIQSGEGTVGRLVADGDIAADLKSSTESIATMTQKLNTPGNTIDKLATGSKIVDNLQQTTKQLEEILTKINSGDGALGKLTNDQQTAEALSKMITNLKALTADIQANPKKYVKLSLF